MLAEVCAYLPHARGDEPHTGGNWDKGIVICPTHVGMNRGVADMIIVTTNLPHARGDEPSRSRTPRRKSSICPTHVGMNRSSSSHTLEIGPSAPRTWG